MKSIVHKTLHREQMIKQQEYHKFGVTSDASEG